MARTLPPVPNHSHHVFHFTPDTLRDWCFARGMPAFRAALILEWVYAKGIIDPASMTNLSRRDRETLASDMAFLTGDVLAHQRASDGTQKLLIGWNEAPVTLPILAQTPSTRKTECVMIPSQDPTGLRRTACVSSQVGCPVGCRFCASGLDGLEANLTAGRIVEQVWRLGRLDGVGRITNVVFMGMGEPLANISNVLHAVRTLAAPWGLGISARRITISTVGLPKAIDRLAEELDLPITLALSLHAPTDDLRRRLIPWAEFTTIRDLLDACQRWFDKTGREITLEYTLLRGVNDQPEHAEALASLARSMRANVNLIRYNEVAGLEFKRPRTDDVRAFQAILRLRHVNAHIRASRGRDIAAACGQLRHEAARASP